MTSVKPLGIDELGLLRGTDRNFQFSFILTCKGNISKSLPNNQLHKRFGQNYEVLNAPIWVIRPGGGFSLYAVYADVPLDRYGLAKNFLT